MKAIRLMSVECGHRGGNSIRDSLYLSINSPHTIYLFHRPAIAASDRSIDLNKIQLAGRILKRHQKSMLRISTHCTPIARMHIRFNYMTRRSARTLINYTIARGGIRLDSPRKHLAPFVDSWESEWSKLKGCAPATDHSKTIPVRRAYEMCY